jgi:hypothetical protein
MSVLSSLLARTYRLELVNSSLRDQGRGSHSTPVGSFAFSCLTIASIARRVEGVQVPLRALWGLVGGVVTTAWRGHPERLR